MCTFVRDLCLVARLKAEGIFKMTCRNTKDMDAGSSSNAYSLSQATQDNMKVVLGSLVGKNPYRILGVYANATSKEMQKNLSRISAFAKVGRSEGFPTDFSAAFRVASAL